MIEWKHLKNFFKYTPLTKFKSQPKVKEDPYINLKKDILLHWEPGDEVALTDGYHYLRINETQSTMYYNSWNGIDKVKLITHGTYIGIDENDYAYVDLYGIDKNISCALRKEDERYMAGFKSQKDIDEVYREACKTTEATK